MSTSATATSEDSLIPCPYVYAGGKFCKGHVVGIEAFKADISWSFEAGHWRFRCGHPRSHYHLVCSEKGNHAGTGRPDAEGMKFFSDTLPPALQSVIKKNAWEVF